MKPTMNAVLHRARVIPNVALVLSLCMAFVMLFNNSAKAKTVYEITDDSSTVTVESAYDTVEAVLSEAGVDLSGDDVVEVNDEGDVVRLSISRMQYASVNCDGAIATTQIREGDTVGTLLERLNIPVGEHDIVSKPLADEVVSGDEIRINRVTVNYYTEEETIPHDSKTAANPDLPRGTVKVTQQGVDGKIVRTYQERSVDGGEVEVSLFNTETVEMQTEITSYGTRSGFRAPSGLSQSQNYITAIDDKAGTVTLKDGTTYKLKGTDTYECTAYSGGGVTCTGKACQVGVIAVDRRLIPLGTKMIVQSENGSFFYGVCVAGDVGGAIKGKRLDLYFNSESTCRTFGRRNLKVYFLGSQVK